MSYTERNYLCDRETYLAMKQDQKLLMGKDDAKALIEKYNTEKNQWYEQAPDLGNSRSFTERTILQKDWKSKEPIEPRFLKLNPRAMNIVYSIIKGKTYKQIEKKVRDHNQPKKYFIEKICSLYGIGISLLEGIEWK